jgi:tetratricopeptide (TPR) repeat protein
MKYLFFIAVLLLGFSTVSGQRKPSALQTKSSLALRYYNAKDYEKAVPLLYDIYKTSYSTTYFRFYINSLIQLEKYEEAERKIQKEIKKQRTPKPELYIGWGYLLKVEGKVNESVQKYNEAIKKIANNKGQYLTVANAFLSWGEYEHAKKTYLRGREKLAGKRFSYELARVYSYLRDYKNMMEEYLNLLRESPKQLPRIQSSLSSAMRLDIDNELREKFRIQVLKRIQTEPQIIGYNRLLIWFLLQEKKFSSALRQSIALDQRTGEEEVQILQLGSMALKNKIYAEAKKAFEYILAKGEGNSYYSKAYLLNLHTLYLQFTTEFPDDIEQGKKLAFNFNVGLDFLGISPATISLILENAHLQAFYLNQTDAAIEILERGLKIPRLKPVQWGKLKTELADIYVYSNDPWEATLIYSQVIEGNKKNSLGDEVKLKKAKLGYYLGNFSWAKAQLDVLKASTSKLTANDAMELSLLINSNLNEDTTAIPLQMFARADLLFFRNKDSLALATLDSISEKFPYNTLVDNILFRKAKIEISQQNYKQAATYLEKIIDEFSYELLADDALFMLAEIYHYNLNDGEKAKKLYKEMLTQFPGSVFTDESREKYRELRKIYPDKINKEDLFMEGNKEELEQLDKK